ncbi:MAG: putative ABC-type ATPase [Crocinitomix sp.]
MKRLRMFAGPNGAGKSTVFDKLDKVYDFGIYLNAAEIEKKIKKDGGFSIAEWGIEAYEARHFHEFILNHSLRAKLESAGFAIDLELVDGEIRNLNNNTNSYEVSILTDFIRQILIDRGDNLSFETVMSHESEIKTLKKSKELGFGNYLYYVGTSSPEINKSRVLERVSCGGHPVKPEKIESCYYDSLSLLIEAIPYTYRTFTFDNSGENVTLVLEIFEGKQVTLMSENTPNWVETYFLNLIQKSAY